MNSRIEQVQKAFRAWNEHDFDGYVGLYASEAIVYGLAPEPVDVQGMRAVYEMMWAGFPDLTIELLDAVSEGDKVAVRFRGTGTQRGEFQGMPATGRSFTAEGISILRYQKDKVVERHNIFDFLSMMQQLSSQGRARVARPLGAWSPRLKTPSPAGSCRCRLRPR